MELELDDVALRAYACVCVAQRACNARGDNCARCVRACIQLISIDACTGSSAYPPQ